MRGGVWSLEIGDWRLEIAVQQSRCFLALPPGISRNKVVAPPKYILFFSDKTACFDSGWQRLVYRSWDKYAV
jgi:hypothetical protein